MMVMIAVFANGLVGFGVRDAKRESRLLLVLPLVVAIAFFLSRISIARGVGRSGYIRKIF
jgi:hypothetical protein